MAQELTVLDGHAVKEASAEIQGGKDTLQYNGRIHPSGWPPFHFV